MKIATVVIGKICSHKGCRNVGRYAEKLSDFWVMTCDEHHGQKINLDLNKIPTKDQESAS